MRSNYKQDKRREKKKESNLNAKLTHFRGGGIKV